MFVSDPLIFTELHKTGGSHILQCLEGVLEGDRIGKHNRVPEELRDRFVVGSIRNPWDWYVSLWGYGCSQRGGVFDRTSHRYGFQYYWRQLNKEMSRTWLTPQQYFRQFLADTQKPVSNWAACYQDSSDPALFRQWLKLVLSPQRRYDVGEGFGFSPISAHSGLLTYRFLKLFTHLDQRLYSNKALGLKENLPSVFQKEAFVDYVIRNEHLESDLIAALETAGVALTNAQKALIYEGKTNKTNTSERRDAAYYYDPESIELINNHESLIIALYGYQPPII